ncbi:hypothetical protein [Streptomyces sp. KR80]|uniref:hypothetical protein n=1 Tax=Streptomyces sp. KR80 TaxID=3457426 RepID=UPI003FD17E28
MALFLLLLLVAVTLGFIGAVVNGLLYLLVVGVIVFIADLVLVGFRLGSGHRKHHVR